MFTVDQIIDTVQKGQKQAVKVAITNDSYRKPIETFIDAQAECTRTAFKAAQSVVTDLSYAMSLDKNVQQFTSNMFNDWTKVNWFKPVTTK